MGFAHLGRGLITHEMVESINRTSKEKSFGVWELWEIQKEFMTVRKGDVRKIEARL